MQLHGRSRVMSRQDGGQICLTQFPRLDSLNGRGSRVGKSDNCSVRAEIENGKAGGNAREMDGKWSCPDAVAYNGPIRPNKLVQRNLCEKCVAKLHMWNNICRNFQIQWKRVLLDVE